MSRSSIALGNLRAVVIVIVLAFHSVLPYLASLPATAYRFDSAPYLWQAFPLIDSQRWFGFDLFCAWQDLSLMALMSVYGFTQDNVKRPAIQKRAFINACVALALELARRGAALLVVGDDTSTQFPDALKEFRRRRGAGMKVNLLANYGWEWDLAGLKSGSLRSEEISRLDLIIRWGGGRRLSGFLPVQSVYADLYVVDEYWPDFDPRHLDDAIDWYKAQDQTLGG